MRFTVDTLEPFAGGIHTKIPEQTICRLQPIGCLHVSLTSFIMLGNSRKDTMEKGIYYFAMNELTQSVRKKKKMKHTELQAWVNWHDSESLLW
jgi:hypothetical protein